MTEKVATLAALQEHLEKMLEFVENAPQVVPSSEALYIIENGLRQVTSDLAGLLRQATTAEKIWHTYEREVYQPFSKGQISEKELAREAGRLFVAVGKETKP